MDFGGRLGVDILINQHGQNWKFIQTLMPNRSQNQLKTDFSVESAVSTLASYKFAKKPQFKTK